MVYWNVNYKWISFTNKNNDRLIIIFKKRNFIWYRIEGLKFKKMSTKPISAFFSRTSRENPGWVKNQINVYLW